jgi:hypothetical protein
VARAEALLHAALTVYGPTSSPLLWGWALEGLAFASVVCVTRPDCPDLDASRAEARARFADAAEAFRVAGQHEQAAHSLAMAEKYGSAP